MGSGSAVLCPHPVWLRFRGGRVSSSTRCLLLLSLLLPWLLCSISGAQQGCVGTAPSDITVGLGSSFRWSFLSSLCLQTPKAQLMLCSRIPAPLPTQPGQEPGHQGREGVAVCSVVLEMSPGNAAWLAGSLFSLWHGFEEAV